jgi:hypothetical protein
LAVVVAALAAAVDALVVVVGTAETNQVVDLKSDVVLTGKEEVVVFAVVVDVAVVVQVALDGCQHCSENAGSHPKTPYLNDLKPECSC